MNQICFDTLELENFKSYEKTNFDFVNGFTIITGRNGSGKTTIIDGLYWCLYDVTTKGRKGDSIIRKRAGKNCSAILKFRINEDQFEVRNYRKHYKYSDSKFLFKNGNDISGNTRKDTNIIIENLLIPSEVFLNCLLFSQYINNSFTEMKNSEQKDILDRMLGFDKFDRYYDLASELFKECNDKYELEKVKLPILENNISRSKELIQADETNLRNVILADEDRRVNLSNTIEKLTQYIESNKDASLEVDLVQNQLSELNRQHSTFLERKRAISETYKTNKAALVEKYKSKADSIESEISSNFSEQLSEIINKINNIELEIKAIITNSAKRLEAIETKRAFRTKEIDELYRPKIEQINNTIYRITADIQEIDKLATTYEKNKTDLENRIEVINKGLNKKNPTCYACGQEIKDKKLEDIKNQLIDLKNELSGLNDNIENDLNKRKKLVCEYRDSKKDLETIKLKYNEELRLMNEKADSVRNETESLAKDKENKLRNSINIIEKDKSKIESKRSEVIKEKKEEIKLNYSNELQSLYNDAQSKSQSLDEKINSIQENINSLNLKFQEVQNKSKLLTKYQSDLNSIKTLTNGDELRFNETKMMIENRIAAEQKNTQLFEIQIAALNKNMDDLEQDKRIASFWKEAFSDSGIKGILLDESIPLLNEKAKELSLLTNNIRVRFNSQKSLKSGDMRNAFNVDVVQTENLTDDRADFSGGEGRIVDIISLICLRNLLERMYNVNINIYLFDEILDSLSPDNIEVAFDFIRNICKENCVILISHTWKKDTVDCDRFIQL
jgi:exonuclease SbcC